MFIYEHVGDPEILLKLQHGATQRRTQPFLLLQFVSVTNFGEDGSFREKTEMDVLARHIWV